MMLTPGRLAQAPSRRGLREVVVPPHGDPSSLQLHRSAPLLPLPQMDHPWRAPERVPRVFALSAWGCGDRERLAGRVGAAGRGSVRDIRGTRLSYTDFHRTTVVFRSASPEVGV